MKKKIVQESTEKDLIQLIEKLNGEIKVLNELHAKLREEGLQRKTKKRSSDQIDNKP
jgi:hypothetical protein